MVVADTSGDANWSLYPYKPLRPFNVIFAVAFFLLGATLLWQCIARYGWKRYTWTMVFACTVWTAAFSTRMASVVHDQNVDVFIAQYVMFFIAPPLFAGAEYFILGRVLAYVPYLTPIHPGRVLSTFVLLDTVVEILAANGASAMATADTKSQRNAGAYRMQASLFVQAFLEVAFIYAVSLIRSRCIRANTWPRNVRIVCWVLYITSVMMLIRIGFRIAQSFEMTKCELSNPLCGNVEKAEWYFYVFEVCNIVLFALALAVFPPGKYLPPIDKVFLHPTDGTERLGPGFANADKRPLWQTIVDPFNVHGICTGKGLIVDRFWECDHPLYHRGDELLLEPPKKHWYGRGGQDDEGRHADGEEADVRPSSMKAPVEVRESAV